MQKQPKTMGKSNPRELSIFEFDDYRAFLKAKFEERKQMHAYFSHRYFAGKAGFKTTSFLQFVVQGKRNLTLESIGKMAHGLGLSVRESRYFEAMVLFNQAETAETRREQYEKLLKLRAAATGRLLHRQQYEYYANWYISVIREMVSLPDFSYDPQWIQARLLNKVSVPMIKNALRLLCDLKLIEQAGDGKWQSVDTVITTGPQVASLQVAGYHRQMIAQARDVVNTIAADDREITSLTASMSRKCFEEIREMIHEFKRSLIEKIVSDSTPEQVYQIQFQMFPFLADKKRGTL